LSSLKLDLRVGESVLFNNGLIKITLLDKSGQRARLDIKANDDVVIETKKLVDSTSLAKNGLNIK
jgi:sRNA-binding carbon storage regulator CsrA